VAFYDQRYGAHLDEGKEGLSIRCFKVWLGREGHLVSSDWKRLWFHEVCAAAICVGDSIKILIECQGVGTNNWKPHPCAKEENEEPVSSVLERVTDTLEAGLPVCVSSTTYLIRYI